MMTHQRLMKDLLSFKVPFHAAICTSLWLNWLLNYDPPDSLEIFFLQLRIVIDCNEGLRMKSRFDEAMTREHNVKHDPTLMWFYFGLLVIYELVPLRLCCLAMMLLSVWFVCVSWMKIMINRRNHLASSGSLYSVCSSRNTTQRGEARA